MNETQINAQFLALVEQRNDALNRVVNLTGDMAILKEQVKSLTAQLEAATSLISDNAEVVENPDA